MGDDGYDPPIKDLDKRYLTAPRQAGKSSDLARQMRGLKPDDQVEVLEREFLRMHYGNVVRWSHGHGVRGRMFTYAALKVGDRWYTTATDANSVVDQILDSSELAILLITEATRWDMAAEWRAI